MSLEEARRVANFYRVVRLYSVRSKLNAHVVQRSDVTVADLFEIALQDAEIPKVFALPGTHVRAVLVEHIIREQRLVLQRRVLRIENLMHRHGTPVEVTPAFDQALPILQLVANAVSVEAVLVGQ